MIRIGVELLIEILNRHESTGFSKKKMSRLLYSKEKEESLCLL
jgi:hypothetical protein